MGTSQSNDWVISYLQRIGATRRHDVRTLGDLQRALLTAVAFENLDVYSGRGVRTDTDWSVPKIVAERRGWWCFELNGAFGALPEALGFSVRYLAATVLLDDRIDPIPTRLALEVTLDRRYLVDLGFGDSFMRPLPIDDVGRTLMATPCTGSPRSKESPPCPRAPTASGLSTGLALTLLR
jgi:N-hydroxyarylamine O-acetyltransferase